MSSALAIASVTHVLKDLLNDGMIDGEVTQAVNGDVSVTVLPPDRIDTENESSQLNLFMYMATHNVGWRNRDLPVRNSQGERTRNPPLALDLHYLLTAYGAEELHHDILLGYGMQLLHENPVLTRKAIRESLTPPVGVAPLSGELSALSTSNLADQIELIKITPEPLNKEEASRLWTAFGAKYRPHAAYKATVVLIESRQASSTGLPVRQRKIFVEPFQRPHIKKIASQTADGEPIIEQQKILSTYNLVLTGSQLKGKITNVNLGGIAVNTFKVLEDTQLVFSLPQELTAGVHPVQVIHELAKDETQNPPVDTISTAASNVEAFVLSPDIPIDINPITVNPVQDPSLKEIAVEIGLTIHPVLGENQRFTLLLNQRDQPPLTPPAAYGFEFPSKTLLASQTAPGSYVVPIQGIKAGNYLVRVQIDGAESSLGYNNNTGYDSPLITIA